MISLQAFLDAIQRNVNRVTHYQSAGDGSGGGCDCIGLIIGAVRLAGGKWPGTHGSNYAARYEMRSLFFITEPFLGEIVYKAREPGEKGYDLPAKYKDSGDLLDYYHVGVVTSVNPLNITHCTSASGCKIRTINSAGEVIWKPSDNGGIKIDTTLGQWRFGGELKLVNYGDDAMDVLYQATVTAVSGRTVNLRQNPSEKAKVLKSIPVGAEVDVLEETDDKWAKIFWNGLSGYMMRKFLKVTEEPDRDVLMEQLEEHLASALEIVTLLRGGDVG